MCLELVGDVSDVVVWERRLTSSDRVSLNPTPKSLSSLTRTERGARRDIVQAILTTALVIN